MKIVDRFYSWLDSTTFAQNICARIVLSRTITFQLNVIPKNIILLLGAILTEHERTQLLKDTCVKIGDLYDVSFDLSPNPFQSPMSSRTYFRKLFINSFEHVEDIFKYRKNSIRNTVSDERVHDALKKIVWTISTILEENKYLTEDELRAIIAASLE